MFVRQWQRFKAVSMAHHLEWFLGPYSIANKGNPNLQLTPPKPTGLKLCAVTFVALLTGLPMFSSLRCYRIKHSQQLLKSAC